MIAHFAEPFASLANTQLRSSVVFRKESTDLELQQLKELQATDVVLPRKKRGHKSRADRRPRANGPSGADAGRDRSHRTIRTAGRPRRASQSCTQVQIAAGHFQWYYHSNPPYAYT